MGKKKILVIDDETDLCEMLEMRLKECGYEVMTAENGETGLVKAKEARPDLIICDVVMPVKDGFAVYKEVRSDEVISNTPIIILTARGKMENSFKEIGAREFMTKPFSQKELMERVRLSLEQAVEPQADGIEDKKVQVEDKKEEAQEKDIKESAEELSAKVQESDTDKPKVLIAGDTSSVLGLIEKKLTAKKCYVEAFATAQELFNRAAELTPNFIILDVLIDGKPAKDLINRLRKLPDFKDKPIIVYSYLDKDNLGDISVHQRAMDIETAKRLCIEAGATDMLSGFEGSDFAGLIKKYLSN